MSVNLSSKRQNELLQETFDGIQACRDEAEAIETEQHDQTTSLKSQLQTKLQALARETTIQRDQLESEWQQKRWAAKEAFQTELKLTKDELQDEVDVAKQRVKKQLSDGEYDWFLSKQRLLKEVEADKEAAHEQYAARKTLLQQQDELFADLVRDAQQISEKYEQPLKVHGGDLLDHPDDSDHLRAHQQTVGRIEKLTLQFRGSLGVRFQEERWYLIAGLLGLLVLPIPAYVASHNNLALAGSLSVVAAGAVAVISWFVSRRLARTTARQFHSTFISAITTGKQQLLAAKEQSKSQCELRVQQLDQHLATQTKKLDDQWRVKQNELRGYLSQRQQELQLLATKRGNLLQQQFTTKEQTLSRQYQPKLDTVTAHHQAAEKELREQCQTGLADAQRRAHQRRTTLQHDWQAKLAQVRDEIQQMQRMANEPELDWGQIRRQWQPPETPAQAIRMGELTCDLETPNRPFPTGEEYQLPFHELRLPAALDLLHNPSLAIETQAADANPSTRGTDAKSRAIDILRLVMVRMLTANPPGKVRFTILDPVGLGQSFSAFMHLADYDEALIQHRIWTEASHIQSRLADLTQHMENVIQSYLRNEFHTIQEYNAHAGEVAEAFRVLIVANFPAGFTEESAQRLLSILSSGPRCGVFTLLSFDPTQKMPRNFDLEDLRRHTNVLTVAAAHTHWQDSPISEYPIAIDELPAEETVTQIMHQIGARAQEASKVEVPFAAVAPASDTWWTGDSRNEISVPLGRAGATKQQALRLGKGTSQHVLISGKTGSGKSTLLHALITNLSLKYSPNEVQFYLIDFKKGVEFKAYAEFDLPHARVIAIESEREFGQSVLQRLDAELRRRGDLFRRVGVQSLAGYRDARPDERMPRILLVIDEFQEFFVKEDKIAQEASLLLDRLVRQGRAFGIHVLLGSQTLAGAYSLARATIGQMAVRIALQCSASDASLILSDDNDAARLLRRPGEAIYNDANGMVEGNHPFQVVWLNDVEKEGYLRELAERQATEHLDLEPAVVFEGNVAADAGKNPQLQNAWSAPAPTEVPLAPRAWLGEAVAIKEAPAVVFHRRSGANLMLVGQQDETALGIMASALLSLAAFSPTTTDARQTRFVVLDGTRPESSLAGYWQNFQSTTNIDVSLAKSRDAVNAIQALAANLATRENAGREDDVTTFLFIYNLSRFRELQRGEDDFGFGGFGDRDDQHRSSPAESLAKLLRDGPNFGMHTILWCESYTNLMRWIDRPSLRDIESRVLFQMSPADSSNLMDSSAASQLGPYRALSYSEDRGRAERFRPYGVPDDDLLLRVRNWNSQRAQSAKHTK